jgi:hypothetical protein
MLQDRKAFTALFGSNCYVPAMGYSAAGVSYAPMRHVLGTPATAAALATLISAQGAVGPITYLATPIVLDAVYGRTITVTPSGVPGNANAMDVVGLDYLNQPMFERFTGSAAASTPLVGLKVFKTILGTRVNVAATNAITNSIGSGVTLGVPWKGKIVTAKEGTTVMTYAQIDTNTVNAVLTDPQTATTGDPRGGYTPTTAPNGALLYELSMVGDTAFNTAGNGGLCGIRHLPY